MGEQFFQIVEFDGRITVKYADRDKGYSFTISKTKFLKEINKWK